MFLGNSWHRAHNKESSQKRLLRPSVKAKIQRIGALPKSGEITYLNSGSLPEGLPLKGWTETDINFMQQTSALKLVRNPPITCFLPLADEQGEIAIPKLTVKTERRGHQKASHSAADEFVVDWRLPLRPRVQWYKVCFFQVSLVEHKIEHWKWLTFQFSVNFLLARDPCVCQKGKTCVYELD